MTVIDEYIATCPADKQQRLGELRDLIRAAAPEATERISWGMPTFHLKGNLVHFALHKNHIGLYPGESGVHHFSGRLGEYRHSKGAIQFPLDQPLPTELITEIVAFRAAQNKQS